MEDFSGMSTGWVIAAAAVILFLLVCFIAWAFSRYQKAGPNEALIVYGGGKYRVVVGGGTIVWPFINQHERLSLELMTLDVTVQEVYTLQGVPIVVDGVAQVKVDRNDEMIRTASERFLGKPTQAICNIALQTLEGHLRAIMGTLTVEEAYRERDEFAKRVAETAAQDLAGMGLRIDSFTIREVRDTHGYLDALGKPRTAQVKRDATIGEAEAQRDAVARSAEANRDGQKAKFAADTEIAEADRDYQMKVANYKAAVQTQKAQADLAYDLQRFTTEQQVRKEQVQVEVVEREMQTQVQEREIVRKERELMATIQKPADAKRYEVETLADAERAKREKEAAGQASAIAQVGKGEAEATRAKGLAEADIQKAQGLAKAEVIRQQGFAEAEAMMKKAAAWQNYNQAAITEKVIEVLPAVASAIAQPLTRTDKIVMINTGGDGGGGVGVSRITNDVSNVIAQLPPVLEALTGINFDELLKKLPQIGERFGIGAGTGAEPLAGPSAPPASES
jgi:flotillin